MDDSESVTEEVLVCLQQLLDNCDLSVEMNDFSELF